MFCVISLCAGLAGALTVQDGSDSGSMCSHDAGAALSSPACSSSNPYKARACVPRSPLPPDSSLAHGLDVSALEHGIPACADLLVPTAKALGFSVPTFGTSAAKAAECFCGKEKKVCTKGGCCPGRHGEDICCDDVIGGRCTKRGCEVDISTHIYD
jgi:hypothetical protein